MYQQKFFFLFNALCKRARVMDEIPVRKNMPTKKTNKRMLPKNYGKMAHIIKTGHF